jgi:hypothetical protein
MLTDSSFDWLVMVSLIDLLLYIPLDIVDWVCYYAMYHEFGSLILLFTKFNMYACWEWEMCFF